MKLLLLRFWLVFHLAEEPDEIDVFGGLCTVISLPLNLIAWLNMAQANCVLSLIISLLSVAWLCMRLYVEWGKIKIRKVPQTANDDEDQ